jgi:hypothetical protein
MSEVPPPVDPDDPRARPLVEPPLVEPPLVEPPLVDPPLVVPPVVPGDVRYVREERVIADGPAPLAGDVDVNAVHEEERVRVLADGTVLREVDRVEQRSRFRDWLPWLLLALVGLVLAVGLLVWYLNRSSSKPVPAVVGLRLDAALSRLQQDGFKVQVTRQSNARPAGVVFGQNPAASTKLDDGSTVRLLVSRGRARAKVPNGVGVAQATARDRLVQAGFRVMTAEVRSATRHGRRAGAPCGRAGGARHPRASQHLQGQRHRERPQRGRKSDRTGPVGSGREGAGAERDACALESADRHRRGPGSCRGPGAQGLDRAAERLEGRSRSYHDDHHDNRHGHDDDRDDPDDHDRDDGHRHGPDDPDDDRHHAVDVDHGHLDHESLTRGSERPPERRSDS